MTHIDLHPHRKGGLRPADPSRPRIDMTPFLREVALPPYADTDPAPALDWPMDLNDEVGDCVCAGWDHFCQAVNALLGVAYTNLTSDQLIALYRTQNPNFDLADPAHGPGSADDGGMVIQLLLENLRNQGLILGFGQVDFKTPATRRAATYVFLALLTGASLQQAQVSDQFEAGTWDFVPGADFIGGHCVPIVGYDTAISWAKPVTLAEGFYQNCMDECWAAITPAHLAHPGFRDNFDLDGYKAAFTALTGEAFPA